MNNEDKTIEYYNNNADSYIETVRNADMSKVYYKFEKFLPTRGRILDLGCGSGRDSKHFIEKGYSLTSIDASQEMCKRASMFIGKEVICMRFDEVSFENEFDAIWACASLLHIEKVKLPSVLEKLATALKKQGILYASFKVGDSEGVKGRRFYSDYTEEEIANIFYVNCQFEILELFRTEDTKKERVKDKWINILALKNSL